MSSQNERIKKLFIKPDFDLDSIYDIDLISLKQRGIKALFFDLDSTLMKSKSGVFSYKILQFLDNLKSNFKLAIITNNKNPEYIEHARSQTTIPIYENSKKPSPKTIYKACEDLKISPKESAIIGDRPLSDILAGKKAGITTILVDSISKDEENKLVRFVRFLERLSIKRD